MVQDELNHLVYYRKRMRLTQPQVARLLGWKNIKGLHLIESGAVLPTLLTAFRLGSIYRAPIEFLFKKHYEAVRNDVRTKEAALKENEQQALPLNYPEERYA
jgi:DNA-binding XRE family transcriptional regulator